MNKEVDYICHIFKIKFELHCVEMLKLSFFINDFYRMYIQGMLNIVEIFRLFF